MVMIFSYNTYNNIEFVLIKIIGFDAKANVQDKKNNTRSWKEERIGCHFVDFGPDFWIGFDEKKFIQVFSDTNKQTNSQFRPQSRLLLFKVAFLSNMNIRVWI